MKLTNNYKLLSKDSFDTCATYAKLYRNKVKVQILYRYGKAVYRIMSIKSFNCIYN